MKLIENNWWPSKQVEYKGNLLIVPVRTNWIATDANGLVVAYKAKPTREEFWWEENSCFDDIQYVGKATFEEGESWKESLEFVGEEQ